MLGTKIHPFLVTRRQIHGGPADSEPAGELASSSSAAVSGALRSGALDLSLVRRAFAESSLARAGSSSELVASAHPVTLDRSAPASRHAVVAVIFKQGPRGVELLLIRRADNPRDPWSGHMALPGGHREPSDVDLVDTAVREVMEEVSVDLRGAHWLGRLPSVQPVARGRRFDLSIVPLVFALEGACRERPNPREVQAIVWARLAHLLSPAATSTFEYAERSLRYRLPAFDVDGHVVWGLTHRVLENLLAVLRPASRELENPEQPAPGAARRHGGRA